MDASAGSRSVFKTVQLDMPAETFTLRPSLHLLSLVCGCLFLRICTIVVNSENVLEPFSGAMCERTGQTLKTDSISSRLIQSERIFKVG